MFQLVTVQTRQCGLGVDSGHISPLASATLWPVQKQLWVQWRRLLRLCPMFHFKNRHIIIIIIIIIFQIKCLVLFKNGSNQRPRSPP